MPLSFPALHPHSVLQFTRTWLSRTPTRLEQSVSESLHAQGPAHRLEPGLWNTSIKHISFPSWDVAKAKQQDLNQAGKQANKISEQGTLFRTKETQECGQEMKQLHTHKYLLGPPM